jgi:hypothetical protein
MDWRDIAGPIAAAGAPTLGKILGDLLPIPGGSILGEWAGKAVAEALGVEPTPEAVAEAVATKPAPEVAAALAPLESEAIVKWRAQAEVGKAQVEAVNETMQAEAKRADGWWGQWRTQLAQMLVLECPVWVGLIVGCIWFGKVTELVSLQGLIMTWWGARFGVLGVHVWTGSTERRTAMTGQPVAGAIAGVVKAIRGK